MAVTMETQCYAGCGLQRGEQEAAAVLIEMQVVEVTGQEAARLGLGLLEHFPSCQH